MSDSDSNFSDAESEQSFQVGFDDVVLKLRLEDLYPLLLCSVHMNSIGSESRT